MSTAYKLASGNVVQHASQLLPSGFLLHPQSFGDGLSGFEINASLRLTPAMIFNMLHLRSHVGRITSIFALPFCVKS